MRRIPSLPVLLLGALLSTPALGFSQSSAPLPPALNFFCKGQNAGDVPAAGVLTIRNAAGAVTTTSGPVNLAPGQILSISEFATGTDRYCHAEFDQFLRADFLTVGAGGFPAAVSMLTPDLSPLGFMEVVRDPVAGLNAPNLLITGINVHLRSGGGVTADSVTGLGNLVVGYAEPPQGGLQPGDREGAHNLTVGTSNIFPSSGSFVAGVNNAANGLFSSVTGGSNNAADGLASVALGRVGVTAAADFSLEPLDTVEANLAQALADAVAALQQAIADGDQAVLDALNAAVAALQQADADLLAALNAAVAALQQADADLAAALNTAVATLQQSIADGDQALLDALNAAVAALQQADADTLAALNTAVTQLTQVIADGDTAVANALTTALNDAVTALQNADQATVAAIDTAVTTLTQLIADGDTNVLNTLSGIISSGDQAVVNTLTTLIVDGDTNVLNTLIDIINML